MVHNSFLPKNGTFNHIFHNDILLIYHMFTREQVNLPFIILKNMTSAANSNTKTSIVPYGMALCKIFRLLKIPLQDEISSFKVSTFGPKNVHQMKTKPESFIPSSVDLSQSLSLKRKRNDPCHTLILDLKNTRSNFFLFPIISNSRCLFYNFYCATNAHFTVLSPILHIFLHFIPIFRIKSYKRVFWSFPAMEPILVPTICP